MNSMKAPMKEVEKANLDSWEEERSFPKGKRELVTVSDITFDNDMLDPEMEMA